MGPINPEQITFDAPTQFTDDTPIPPGTLARFEYGFSQTAGGPYSRVVQDAEFESPKQRYDLDLSGFAFGQWYAVGRAVSKDGPVSAWSNEAAFEVRAKEPKPPTGFSVA